MKALVAAFNQEKALVGAFSVITNLRMQLFEALFSGVAAALEDRRRSVLAQLRSRVEGKCKRLGGGGESEDDITADDPLFAETQSEQLRQAEAGAEAGEVVVVETPHVSVSWAGLEEVKQLTGSLGEVASSSCIPSVSTVGGWQPGRL